MNIRGLNSKIGELMYLIDNSFKYQSPEIVMLCETWLKSNSPHPHIPGYKLERHDCKRKQGGGTGMLISTKCKYRRRDDLEQLDSPSLESCFIELETNKKNIIFGSIYRPPNTPPDEFTSLFNKLVRKINDGNPNINVVIGLDHYMDLLKQTIITHMTESASGEEESETIHISQCRRRAVPTDDTTATRTA